VFCRPTAMRFSRFLGSIDLLRQGIAIMRDYGLRSADRLGRVAEFLERSVYEPGSLRATSDGVALILRNPPLRVGAFSSLRALWDGTPVAPHRAFVRRNGEVIDRPLSDVSAERPVNLAAGRKIFFRFVLDAPAVGEHRVRIELQNLAIPPLVWFEFVDSVRPRENP
jgi:hypothetical protein